jgi:hypothetical protein
LSANRADDAAGSMEAPEEALRAIACIGIAHGDAATPRESWTLVQCGSGFFLRGTGLVMTCEHVRIAARRYQYPGSVLVVCPYIGAAAPLDLRHAWEADVLARTNALPWNDPSMGDDHAVVVDTNDDAAVLRVRCEFVSKNPPRQPEPATGALAIPELGAYVHTLQLGDSGQLRATQSLFALGFPVGAAFGMTPTPSSGSFAEQFRDEYGVWLKYEGMASEGSSGGPVVTGDGSVIGWVVRQVGTIAAAGSGIQHLRPIEEARACIEAGRAAAGRAAAARAAAAAQAAAAAARAAAAAARAAAAAAGAAAHAGGGAGGEPEEEQKS